MLVAPCVAQNASPRPPQGQEQMPWSLQYAAAHRQSNVISMLISMGVDVNALGSEGNRALDIACLNGDAATTEVLLAHGANPNLRNKAGTTPLHDASLRGKNEVIELLLKHGANVNATDSETGFTPLHYAASFNRLEAVKSLVQHGADLSIRNKEGLTALELSRKNGFSEISEFLAEKTASRPAR